MSVSGTERLEREELLLEANRISGLVIRAAELAKCEFARAIEPFGVPLHLARAILALDTPAPMRDLASSMACDRSYITGLADQLEDRRFVTRVTGEDRRVKLLQLTAEGRRVRDEMSRAVAQQSLVLLKLTEPERRTLEALMLKLVDPG